jgi:hypothetical protein
VGHELSDLPFSDGLGGTPGHVHSPPAASLNSLCSLPSGRLLTPLRSSSLRPAGLVLHPSFGSSASRRLLLTTLGTLLTRDGELRLTSVWGATLDTTLLSSPSPTPTPLLLHPSLPFSAKVCQLGTLISTAYLGGHASPLLPPCPTHPLPLPLPLPPLRLPDGREAHHVLWLHESTRLDRQSPCVLVVDTEGGLFLYQYVPRRSLDTD